MKHFSQFIAAMVITSSGIAMAHNVGNDCGAATQNLIAAQVAWNQAATAVSQSSQICKGNLQCMDALGRNLDRASRNLNNASSRYNSACR